MQTALDCFPCFLRQTLIALKQTSGANGAGRALIDEVLVMMRDVDVSKPPAHFTTFMHRLIRERLGCDPFEEVKSRFNRVALEHYPSLKRRVRESKDPLHTASRLAIAGNIIDFGVFTSIDIGHSIEQALRDRIAVDDYESFLEAISGTSEVLYLLDNSGEIVFDRILIEELISCGKKVKAVVKGAAVLNDATREDALEAGLTGVCEVIDNGSDAIGTILEWTSPSFQREFRDASLVISKGQGNFETLVGSEKRTYFLFQSKCDVVSKELGLAKGSMLLKKS